MKITEFLKDALITLEEEIPPYLHGHHAITVSLYGEEMEEELTIQINDGGTLYAYTIEEDDLENSPDQFVSDILLAHAEAKKDPNTQLGISGVRYS